MGVRGADSCLAQLAGVLACQPGMHEPGCWCAEHCLPAAPALSPPGCSPAPSLPWAPRSYQDEKPFVSAKKVLGDLGAPYSNSVELASFHTGERRAAALTSSLVLVCS